MRFSLSSHNISFPFQRFFLLPSQSFILTNNFSLSYNKMETSPDFTTIDPPTSSPSTSTGSGELLSVDLPFIHTLLMLNYRNSSPFTCFLYGILFGYYDMSNCCSSLCTLWSLEIPKFVAFFSVKEFPFVVQCNVTLLQLSVVNEANLLTFLFSLWAANMFSSLIKMNSVKGDPISYANTSD